MNILFVCSRNRWRSLTAEHLFKKMPNWNVRSVGTSDKARVKVAAKDIIWAEVIFVMERKHQQILTQRFPQEMMGKKVICLNIPDEYGYMDEELVEVLQASVKEL